jgi:hypothetical protein
LLIIYSKKEGSHFPKVDLIKIYSFNFGYETIPQRSSQLVDGGVVSEFDEGLLNSDYLNFGGIFQGKTR